MMQLKYIRDEKGSGKAACISVSGELIPRIGVTGPLNHLAIYGRSLQEDGLSFFSLFKYQIAKIVVAHDMKMNVTTANISPPDHALSRDDLVLSAGKFEFELDIFLGNFVMFCFLLMYNKIIKNINIDQYFNV